MPHRLDDVATAGLALRADHRRALADAPQRLAQVAAAADERHAEIVLVDVEVLVGHRQDFALVDAVDAELLQDLRLGEVADAALGHDRDVHRGHNRGDHLGVAHPRHTALHANVRGDPLQRHHGHRARVLGDPRMLDRDHIHDHAAAQFLHEGDLLRPGVLAARLNLARTRFALTHRSTSTPRTSAGHPCLPAVDPIVTPDPRSTGT